MVSINVFAVVEDLFVLEWCQLTSLLLYRTVRPRMVSIINIFAVVQDLFVLEWCLLLTSLLL